MSQSFGIPAHGEHATAPHRPPARYLVVIEGDSSSLARLFSELRAQVGQFDAGTEEVATMTRGLVPTEGAVGAEWDAALASHSTGERAAAQVYTLDV